MGVRGIIVYCANYACSHSIPVSADHWPDDLRLSDIEHRFVCEVCGKRGADVRPDFTHQDDHAAGASRARSPWPPIEDRRPSFRGHSSSGHWGTWTSQN
jgi:hypothetical protein